MSITASATLQTLAQKKIRKPTARVYIMWDGFNWVDETDRLKAVSGFEEMGGGLFEQGMSEIDVSFYNEDYHFTVGHENCSITEEQRVPKRKIKVEIGFNSYHVTRFFGYIESYTPDIKAGEFRIHAFDRAYQLTDKFSGYVFFENYTPTELIQWLGELAGIPISEMELDETDEVIPFTYFEDRSIWFLMGQIAGGEGGRVFFDNAGKLTFWNRNHISFTTTAAFTFKYDDYILDQPYEISDKDIKNIIQVKSQSRQVYEEQVVWDVEDEFKDEFKRVNAHNGDDNNDLQFNVTLQNPVTTFVRPLEAGVDYIANTEPDGSGTDITADIEIVELRTYIKGIVFRIRYNDTAGIAYFTTLQVRGTPAKVYSKIDIEVSDDYSIGLYGDKIKTIDNPFIQNTDYAAALAQIQLNMFANTVSNFSTEVVAIPWITTGDIVAVQTIPESEDVTNYLVTKVAWTWEPRAGAKMILNLAINYAEYNRIEEGLEFSSESHDFIFDSGVYHWGEVIEEPLIWTLGAWS